MLGYLSTITAVKQETLQTFRHYCWDVFCVFDAFAETFLAGAKLFGDRRSSLLLCSSSIWDQFWLSAVYPFSIAWCFIFAKRVIFAKSVAAYRRLLTLENWFFWAHKRKTHNTHLVCELVGPCRGCFSVNPFAVAHQYCQKPSDRHHSNTALLEILRGSAAFIVISHPFSAHIRRKSPNLA